MLFDKLKNSAAASAAGDPFPPSNRLLHSRLFRKYFIMLFTMFFVLTSISGLIMIRIVTREYRQQRQGELYSTAKNIANLSGSLLSVAGGGDYIADYENAVAFICYTIKNFSDNSGSDIFLVSTDGKILICRDMLDLGSENVRDRICAVHSNISVPEETLNKIASSDKMEQIDRINGIDLRKISAAACPIRLTDSEKTLTGFIFITTDYTESLQSSVNSAKKQILISAVFSIIIATALIYFMISRFLNPLREVLYATRMYAKGDFSYRISESSSNDEIHELTKAFNSMANELSAIENSRRNFVANVSHELKTPMTTIGGFIDGILDGTIPTSQHKKYLSIASDEVRRLSRLISSMLNMSKIEAGELTPAYTQFEISDMIVRTFLSFEQAVSQRNINITGLDSLEGITVRADPDMINQVIYNIIDNAVKFTPDNGEISVSCRKAADKAVVKVRNYGVGIANDELKMVFDRFYKVDKSRSLNTKSVGLGLYICKSIVELHNGKIYAESEDGKYTEFTIELPIRQN